MKPVTRLAGVLLLGVLPVSALLAPGGSIPLPSSTAATEPDLAGVVQHDALIPFVIKDTLGRVLCRGQLQDRVVRSTKSGRLHFYYRIRGGRKFLRSAIRIVTTDNFDTDTLSVGWRLDGLGTVNPTTASRTATGETIEFAFKDPVLRCGAESRFFFIKTNAEKFVSGGMTKLALTTGESVSLKTVMPAP